MSDSKIHNLRRSGSDPRVKKTLVRNTERRVTSPEPIRRYSTEKAGTNPVRASLQRKSPYSAGKGDGNLCTQSVNKEVQKLDQPKLCSSLALHKYIEQVKISQPLPVQLQDLGREAKTINEKVSKQLNFPFDRPIYKNLISLNDSATQTTMRANISYARYDQRSSKLKLSQREIDDAINNIFLDESDDQIDIKCVRPRPSKPLTNYLDTTELYKNESSFQDLSSDCSD